MNSAQIPVNRLRISRHTIAGANTTLRNKMKLSIKQRIRNWLMDDSVEECYATNVIEQDRIESSGMRLQIYRASGGFVVETRKYDERKSENINTMHVITEDQDLGESLGKIVMMEALRG